MSSPAFDISQYLTNVHSHGTIYVGREPAEATAALLVTIYDTGGEPTENWAGYENPTIQVRASAVSYPDGHNKLSAIRGDLVTPRGFEYDGYQYSGFWLITDVAFIGYDDRNRAIFTVNFRLMREPLEI